MTGMGMICTTPSIFFISKFCSFNLHVEDLVFKNYSMKKDAVPFLESEIQNLHQRDS